MISFHRKVKRNYTVNVRYLASIYSMQAFSSFLDNVHRSEIEVPKERRLTSLRNFRSFHKSQTYSRKPINLRHSSHI